MRMRHFIPFLQNAVNRAACAAAFAALTFLAAVPGRCGPPTSLAELEAAIRDAPPVLTAAAALEESLSLLAHEQAVSGLKFFTSAGTGSYKEAVDDDSDRTYNQAFWKVGLRYPLLGTRNQERLNILAAEAKTWEDRQVVAAARRSGLNTLRDAYISYWGSARKIALSRAFLADRDRVAETLRARKEKGFLLDADLQEFLTAFFLAERHIADGRALQRRALGIINLLTRARRDRLICQDPVLPAPCLDEQAVNAAVLDSHPDLLLLRGRIDRQTGINRIDRFSDLEANVDLSGALSQDYPDGEAGYGVALTFNMQLPVAISQAETAKRLAQRAALRKLQLTLEQESGELLAAAAEAVGRCRTADANLAFARQRVRAALEGLRVNTLRRGYLEGDTIEKLQQSRLGYYQAGLDLIEAQVASLKSRAALLRFAPEGCGTTEPPLTDSVLQNDPVNPDWLRWPKEATARLDLPPTAAVDDRSPGISVYLWRSTAFLESPPENPATWQPFLAAGVDRILLSLDGDQIAAASRPEGRARLAARISAVKAQGIRVELLLGDPLWILPGQRRNLLGIVQTLAPIPFDGLHLDLEPNQLDARLFSEEYLLGQLVRTLESVRRISPWPLGLSLHPRYLDAKRYDYCLGCALGNLDLAEVTLMVYVADDAKVAERVAPLLDAYPEIRFSAAISVEPFVDGGAGWAGMGAGGVRAAIARLDQALPQKNFTDIVVQSWHDWQRLTP